MEGQLSWGDIIGWVPNHPYISCAVAAFFLFGWTMQVKEQSPRFWPILQGIWIALGFIAFWLGLFFWIIPGIKDAIAAHSVLEIEGAIVIVLLFLMGLVLVLVHDVLVRIRNALERGNRDY